MLLLSPRLVVNNTPRHELPLGVRDLIAATRAQAALL
jgi:hypothetical protein